MRWLSLALLTTCLIRATNAPAAAQGLSGARQLLAELQVESASDRAADQLRVLAQRDPEARQFLAEQLPTLIEKVHGPAWLNAVHLTGDLKIVEAVPVLAELLRDPLTKGGATNFGMALRLGDDPPGRALADIGEPATEAVGALLVDQDRFKRWRAALVLGNINSAHADQLLELRLSHEDDPAVRAQIQSLLGERRKAKAP